MRIALRSRLIFASVLGAAALIPASAWATTAAWSGTNLTVKGQPGEANDLVLSYFNDGANKYSVFEQGAGLGITSPDNSCEPYGDGSPPAVTCVDGGLTTGVLKMGDRADAVCTCGAIPLTMSLTILGGEGGDDLTGGQAPEVIKGGRGKDVLSGGDVSSDVLVGGPGADKFFGSDYVPDQINAKDGERDKVIDCGDGDDPKPKYDHGLDPKPLNC